MGILDSLLRCGLEDWADSPTGFQVPRAIRTVDDIFFHPEKLYSPKEFATQQGQLDHQRYEAVARLGPELHRNIRKVFPKA